MLEFNPFKHADYKMRISGPFREELNGQKYTPVKNPRDEFVKREIKNKKPGSLSTQGIPEICVSCLGAIFANLRYSWRSKRELPVNLFPDRDRFELFLIKADFAMRDPLKLDKLDTMWLIDASVNFKILLLAFYSWRAHVDVNGVGASEDTYPKCSCESSVRSTFELCNIVNHWRQIVSEFSMWDVFEDDETAEQTKSRWEYELALENNASILWGILQHNIYICEDAPKFSIFTNVWSLIKDSTGGQISLSESLLESIEETFKFYSGFRVQPGWHGDDSTSIRMWRFCTVIRNRFFHPKRKRRILHKKLLSLFREKLQKFSCDIDVNIAAELCVLAVYIDVLNTVGAGFYSIEQDGRSFKNRHRKPLPKKDLNTVLKNLERI